MRKILTMVVGLCVLASTMTAQIFWKVEKPGNEKVSYILGTHHFAPNDVLETLPAIPAALENADKLYGELDMSTLSSPSTITIMQGYILAPADSMLNKVMSPAQLDSLRVVWNQVTGGQAPLEMVYQMKPAGIGTQIAAMLAMQLFPKLDPTNGLDKLMQDKARALGKPVEGLETIEFQCEKLYNTPISKQVEGLMKTVNDFEGEKQRSVELSEAYIAHDLNRLEQLIKEEESDPEEYEQLLYSRNDAWVAQLVKEMPTESLVVVVGAGHLPGERGVLEQLRKAGYTVTPAE